MIPRRHATLGLAAGIAGLGLGRAHAQAPLLEAARKEGEVTWYTAHTDGETAQAVGRAFSERYPGIKANVVRTTAQVAYERLSQELRTNTLNCDVFSSTDAGHYVALKSRNLLAQYAPPNAAEVAPDYRREADGFSIPTTAQVLLLTFNTQKVPAANAPKSWPDLTDPKWRGQVSLGHPGFSGVVGTWVVAMRKLYGWSYFEKLERNRPKIGRSINDTVTMLNAGERSVACGAAPTTILSIEKGNPLALAYPTDGALLVVQSSGILAGAPHPNAARLFLEFLLSADHARLMVRQGGESIRLDVPGHPRARPLSEVKVLQLTTEEIATGIPEVIEQWRDTFGT